jgi:hypothetical protein
MLCEPAKGNARLGSIYAKGVSEFLDVLSKHYGDQDSAAAALSCFVGARVISRAVEAANPELAEQFGAVLSPGETQPRVHSSN